MLKRKIMQEVSEIDLFNVIGKYSEEKGYNAVYFKDLMPKIDFDNGNDDISYVYMHYVHICKDEEVKYSIYYDEHNVGSMYPEGPYYEFWDRCEIERFRKIISEEDRLLEMIKTII